MPKDSKNYEARSFTHKASITDSILFSELVSIIALFVSVVYTMIENFDTFSCLCLLVSFLSFILFLILTIRNKRYDFSYTIIVKENCFTIEGTPHATWYAWPLDCTYEFNAMKNEVTIYDSIGNHRTYLCTSKFLDFLKETQKN